MTRILMTLDAVGGVWTYALDLARAARAAGFDVALAGLGPAPSAVQRAEAEALGSLDWGAMPLDWLADEPEALAGVPEWLEDVAARRSADLLHLAYPSQAIGLSGARPVVTVAHSCLRTWFDAVHGRDVPPNMAWQARLTARGLAASDVVVAPSQAHAAALRRLYDIDRVAVVRNASGSPVAEWSGGTAAIAAARWWDEGKGAATIDAAAALTDVPVCMIGSLRGPQGQVAQVNHAKAAGPLPYTDTLAAISRAAVFVSPSLYEPFGLAALEAARTSRPLLMADIPSYRELWADAACFFDPRSPADLAAKLDALMAAPDRRRAMGRRARIRAQEYDLATQGRAMAALWRRMARLRSLEATS